MSLENSEVKILKDCLDAIEKADLIVLGPGSLYTSVIPNLLINEMADAIIDAKAKTVYICNVMTQAGETENFKIIDHVKAVLDHSKTDILDYCFANSTILDERQLKNYSLEDSTQVLPTEGEIEELENLGIKLVTGDFIDTKEGYIRSDSGNLSVYLGKVLDNQL